MKRSLGWVLAAVPLLVFADEVPVAVPAPAGPAVAPQVLPFAEPDKAAPAPAPAAARSAWLGLRVVKPDETTTSHLPSLPPGIGFVVLSVDEGGPAEAAGLNALDVVWKFGDQMLVNEGQLAVLLGHREPGDEVVLSLFRSGRPMELTITLGDAPPKRSRFRGEIADAAILPGEGGPMKVVNVGNRTASYSTEEGQAWIQREGDDYKVVVHGPDGKLVFEGKIPSGEELDTIPKEWRRRVCALRRGLDHALEGRMVPVRPPRPRVVPSATPDS
jgi:hypothetical protein